MINFSNRNLKVFFRDRASVFFSLLSVFIIIGLYALFLGDVWLSEFKVQAGARFLMDSWIMAGILAVTAFTTTMGAIGTMIDDRAHKIDKDFFSSPVKRSSIIGGYILSALIIGTIMSLVALVLVEFYIVLSGGEWLNALQFLKVFGVIVLATFASVAMILVVAEFIRSQSAFAAASTVVGTLIGFLTGIYLPIGQLPAGVQTIIKIFPPSHAGALMRQIFMEKPLQIMFENAPAGMEQGIKEMLGVVYIFGGKEISPLASVLYLVASGVVFMLIAILVAARKKE